MIDRPRRWHMNFFHLLSEKWNMLCQKAKPVTDKIGEIFDRVVHVLKRIAVYVIKLRKIFLAVPVAWGAIWLALNNLAKLPKVVGINLMSDGNFSMVLDKLPAVLAPLLVTAVCLLLMFCSKRTLTPWLVSVFSLALPLLILLINTFPA